MNFGTCPKKVAAREATIMRAYRKAFGWSSVPQDQDYWTLCGPMTERGQLAPRCELRHVLDAGFITGPQFKGVEVKHSIHEANVRAVEMAFPAARTRPDLVCGDIVRVMGDALANGRLRPGVVNLDTQHEPPRGAMLLARVLNILNAVPGPTMVVWNVIVKSPKCGKRYTFDTKPGTTGVVDVLRDNSFFQHVSAGWDVLGPGAGTAVEYGGTGPRATAVMGTLVFTRQAALKRKTG